MTSEDLILFEQGPCGRGLKGRSGPSVIWLWHSVGLWSCCQVNWSTIVRGDFCYQNLARIAFFFKPVGALTGSRG